MILKTQTFMSNSAESCFLASELANLRCLIRITFEFHHYLEYGNLWFEDNSEFPPIHSNISLEGMEDQFKLDYMIGTIVSGIDSFTSVNNAYHVLVGAIGSTLDWSSISMQGIKEKFISVFCVFENEEIFENKCRLLLDLYKLQIVFCGVFYT